MEGIRVTKVDNVILERLVPAIPPSTAAPTKQRLTGTLHLTPHHLFFTPTAQDNGDAAGSEIWIPYPTIILLTRLPQSIQGLYPLQIRTRTFEGYILLFERDRNGGAEDVWQSVKDCAVASSVEQLYAFYYTLPSNTKATPPVKEIRASSSQLGTPLLDATPTSPAISNHNEAGPSTGWNCYNPRTEFARQGLGSRTKAWRFTDVNKDYSYSPTYPNKLVVPSRISDSVLAYAGKYRSKARIPALSYLHWASHASITRSSQPMVGLKNARSAQDERLIECIFSSHLFPETAYNPTTSNPLSPQANTQALPGASVYGATSTNLIIDARPTTNAMANVAMGAGTENMDNYRSAKKAYLGIDNIHVMRSSLKMVDDAIRDADENRPLDRGMLRKSNWLKHISTLLDGSLIIVRNVHLNASHVLIHCSDGWDRTSQLSAIAQLCLDPYYRTIEGFKVLVEKDWLSFGHKFMDRSGHLSSEQWFTVMEQPEEYGSDEEYEFGGRQAQQAQKAAQAFFASMQKQFSGAKSGGHTRLKEISPVFHQFLDCVRQIQRQFPTRFQFNEDFLLDLYTHLYSCQFGTFIFNNEQERRVSPSGAQKPYIERTVSIWDQVDRDQAKYLNAEFDSTLDDRESRDSEADMGVLLPDPKDVKFWFRLFKRGNEEMNGGRDGLPFQAVGAQVSKPIGAGQIDPISVEGAIKGVAGAEEVLGPGPTSASGLGTGSTFDPLSSSNRPSRSVSPNPSPSSSSANLSSSTPSRSTQNTLSPTPRSAHPLNESASSGSLSGTGGGWGRWSQLSTGAFTALQGAAGQIKNISQEAMNQIRAEVAEVEPGRSDKFTESTTKSQMQNWSSASTYGGAGSTLGRPSSTPGSVARLPSERNPWALADAERDATPRTESGQTRINPWDRDVGLQKGMSGLSIQNKETTGMAQPPPQPPVAKPITAATHSKAEEEAALGGDTKAWDPLGAL